jgi:hypothetical protein
VKEDGGGENLKNKNVEIGNAEAEDKQAKSTVERREPRVKGHRSRRREIMMVDMRIKC